MMHSKNRKLLSPYSDSLHTGTRYRMKWSNGYNNMGLGFTLIEVMLSMMITSLVLTPVFIMHTMIMDRVTRSSRAYDYIVLCKNLLQQARQKQEPDAQTFSFEQPGVDFDGTLTYSLEKSVNPKSSFASIVGLHKEVVKISWTQLGVKKEEQLVAFVYKKPEEKQKK